MRHRMLTLYLGLIVAGFLIGPAHASSQECEDRDGKPRECTITEDLDRCLEAAIDAAKQRAEKKEGSKWTRFVWFSLDVAGCAGKAITPFT